MQLGIVGLARSGKTTVFNAVTRGHARTGSFGHGVEPNVGTVKVPDHRLDRLAALFKPKKVTHADITYLDFPGGFSREGAPPQLLASLARADALVAVIRAFEDDTVPHPLGSVDPARDIAALNLELAFADAAFLEKRLERLDTAVRSMRAGEREAAERELALLRRMKADLEREIPIRAQQLTPEDRRLLSSYQFLTDKPLLIVLNLGERDLPRASEIEAEYRERFGGPGVGVTALSGKLEAELAELPPEEAAEFARDLGVTESGLDRMVRLSYELVGLISFFTVGPDECRAWTVRRGTPAQQAAGKIHSDMERGFIRAEVVRWDELLADGSLAEARKRGHLRQEGKQYIVQDGDVMHVLFNV
ncbi:MAG TPA: redox-regulated ATPase YchF [Dehalococcoidia bacterium]|nr:redox-regulated ATPase YchF [Dehalococcoidia bacterium]